MGATIGGGTSSVNPNQNTCDQIVIETTGNATDFGDLTVASLWWMHKEMLLHLQEHVSLEVIMVLHGKQLIIFTLIV